MGISPEVFEKYLKECQTKLPASKAWRELDFSKSNPPDLVEALHQAAAIEVAHVTANFFGGEILSRNGESAKAAWEFMSPEIARKYHRAGLAPNISEARQLFSKACMQMRIIKGEHLSRAPSF